MSRATVFGLLIFFNVLMFYIPPLFRYPCVSLYSSGQCVSVLSTNAGIQGGQDGFFSGFEGVVERAESKISAHASSSLTAASLKVKKGNKAELQPQARRRALKSVKQWQ